MSREPRSALAESWLSLSASAYNLVAGPSLAPLTLEESQDEVAVSSFDTDGGDSNLCELQLSTSCKLASLNFLFVVRVSTVSSSSQPSTLQIPTVNNSSSDSLPTPTSSTSLEVCPSDDLMLHTTAGAATGRSDDKLPSSPQLTEDDEEETEWQLSCAGEMASLNWGDGSSDSILSEDVTSKRTSESSAKLVDFESPPLHRVSTSRSPIPPPLVRFSPLSLAPSPLIGAPPPTPHHCTIAMIDFSSQRAILKRPGTPGTGRSVRFSASTREPTPPSMARFANLQTQEIGNDSEVEPESSESFGDGGDSRKVASFLSQLQATIPSPDSSFTESVHTSPPPLSVQPRVTISSPSTPSITSAVPHLGSGLDMSNIFDTSAPRFIGDGISIEGWSALNTVAAEENSDILSMRMSTALFFKPPPNSLSSSLSVPTASHAPLRNFRNAIASSASEPLSVGSTGILDNQSQISGPRFIKQHCPKLFGASDTSEAYGSEPSIVSSLKGSASTTRAEAVFQTSHGNSSDERSHQVPSAPSENLPNFEDFPPNGIDGEDVSQLSDSSDEVLNPLIRFGPPLAFANVSANESLAPIYEESEENTTFGILPPSLPVSRAFESNEATLGNVQLSTIDSEPLRSDSFGSPHNQGLQISSAILSGEQLASDGSTEGIELAQALLSTQQDISVNSSSQRLLLSSLVTSLRLEVDRKDAIIERLQISTEQLVTDWSTLLVDMEAWEAGGCARSQADAKFPAMVRIAQSSTDRIGIQDTTAKDLQDENDRLRGELQTWKLSVRDGEIRLRQAQASQAEAESLRKMAEESSSSISQKLKGMEQDSLGIRRERDDGLESLRQEVITREGVIESLRTRLIHDHEVATSSAAAASLREKEQLELEVESVKRELEEHLRRSALERETIASLQSELELQRGSRLPVKEQDNLSEQIYQDAILNAESLLHDTREELVLERDEKNHAESELFTVGARCAILEAEVEQLHLQVQTVENTVRAQTQSLQERIRTQARSEQNLSELSNSRQQIKVLLSGRETELVDIQTKLASQCSKAETLQRDLNRSKELVVVLRRESADHEVQVMRLKRSKAELLEDNMGLNIALDAKQHEVSMWKRQVSTARLPPLQDHKLPSSIVGKRNSPPVFSGTPSNVRTILPVDLLREETPSRPAPSVRQSNMMRGSERLVGSRILVGKSKENISPQRRGRILLA